MVLTEKKFKIKKKDPSFSSSSYAPNNHIVEFSLIA